MIHESIVILVLSIAFTLVFSSATGTKISSAIQPGVIFSYLLPPIILAAGFNMRKKFFFKNIGYIGMFGFLGTLINFFVVCTAFYFINQIVGGIVGNYLYDNIDPEKSG
jgi:NhaP-type Na+/H+ or K+/H+ antiporter